MNEEPQRPKLGRKKTVIDGKRRTLYLSGEAWDAAKSEATARDVSISALFDQTAKGFGSAVSVPALNAQHENN